MKAVMTTGEKKWDFKGFYFIVMKTNKTEQN